MRVSHSSSDYHSRFCALRNWKVSLIFFLFSALQVILRWRALGAAPQGQQRSVIFYVAVVAVIAALGDLMMALKCLRERVVLILAMASFTFILVKGLMPGLVIKVAITSGKGMLMLWIVASIVSLSMLRSASRVARLSRRTGSEDPRR